MPLIAPGADPVARFDDTESGRSLVLRNGAGAFRADDLDEVRPAIRWAAGAAASGHWVAGYVAYDAAPAFDEALTVRDGTHGPLAWFGAFEDADTEPWGDVSSHHTSRWTPALDEASYGAAFDRVREAIRVGDTYQVNLTFPVRASFSGDPRSLYRELLRSQGVAYAAYLDLGDLQVVSVSPERFFTIDGRRITTQPMKGTRRRGRWRAEDRALGLALERSEKDRAENLMIVDLIRNDVGRIATAGSVETYDLFSIAGYQTVWQMTSSVSADLRNGASLVDVFDALFPCGSVTGAPKASTMGIIADVEGWARGAYCGAIGFIPPGDGVDGASFSVAIRTAVVDPADGVVTYGVGGGLTWDSTAGTEYREALAKAVALIPSRTVSGLFETIRWDDGWVAIEEHLDRMEWSAAVHGMPFERAEAVARLAVAVADANGPRRVRLTLDPRGSLTTEVGAAPERFAMGPGPASDVVALAIDHEPVDPADRSLYVKTTDRSIYDSRRRRHPDADDVVLTNTEGNITESSIANVAVLVDGTWVTPPVADGLLPGILRARLVADGVLTERSVSVAEAVEADGLALLNSIRGWRPATLASASSVRRAGSR